MRLEYDAAVNCAYLRVGRRKSPRPARQLTIDPTTIADLDASGRLIGIEFLAADRAFTADELHAAKSPVIWLSVKAAAAEAGLSPSTLRVLIHNGRLPARKEGRDNRIALHDLWTYLEGRHGGGEPPRPRPAKVSRAGTDASSADIRATTTTARRSTTPSQRSTSPSRRHPVPRPKDLTPRPT